MRYGVCPECNRVVRIVDGRPIRDGQLNFHISDAGLAGDPDKLLVGVIVGGEFDGRKFTRLVDPYGLFGGWRLERAKKALVKKARILLNIEDDYYVA
jgi:hypothetical protein